MEGDKKKGKKNARGVTGERGIGTVKHTNTVKRDGYFNLSMVVSVASVVFS